MWEPATDIEQRMRDALRAGQQEDYFRVLARMELLLPIAEEASNSPNGSGSWATWATEDRTHVLAFTSPEAMQSCLRSHAGAFRTVRFTALSEAWPDSQWWLAVNPGTPIEGYLPAWFVQQVASGDVALPEQQTRPDDGYSDGGWGEETTDPYYPAPGGYQDPPPYGQTSSVTPPAETGGLPRRAPAQAEGDVPQRDESAYQGSYDSGLPQRDGGYQESYDAGLPQRDESAYQGSYDSGLPQRDGGYQESYDAGLPQRDGGYQESYDAGVSGQPDYSGSFGAMPQREAGAGIGGHEETPRESSYPGEAFNSADSGYAAYPGQAFNSAADSYQQAAPAYPGQAFNAAQEAYQPAVAPEPTGQPAPSGGGELVPVSTGWPSEEAVEERLVYSAGNGNTQAFLETLLRAWAYLPVADDCPPSARPGDPEFRWHTDLIDGSYTITAFTTAARLSGRYGSRPFVKTTFGRLTSEWPGIEYSLYVNPSTEVGANVPGPQVTTLVTWARTQGLLDAALEMEAFNPPSPVRRPVAPEVMQKVLPHRQVEMTLDRGYDRVAGFVHRYVDVEELNTPEQLYNALGLLREGTDFSPSDEAVHVVRWVGHRTELYQVAYGGNDPEAARQNGGWIVEPPPFSGDGFAPSVAGRRITEYKVDSVRLPHGAQMHRVSAAGEVREIATYDSDRREWVRSDVAGGGWESDPFRQEQQHA